ncbi:AbrB/MazE/SpoVT family DNA-binding domain-containing protein [Bacillus sp. V2I10]|uniref:AbrB/MazE/SpoVT family DNA-binding domain-containing protein n=1 Tax=Bacillus sp. V2I10 TaxID=3042276 RepID=UPI0027894091|nr:AbrB/MazE/SpoVT family DNA-binding domain-containing protein [Bacillus sp. V2I10]MDQ0859764.1 transcriptional pleiotropic regulator of transition state genes [Bacillus sp. V2I10]
MKSTGIVRKVDELGRLVIPIELRRVLDIDVKDAVEILVDEDLIILKKYSANMACSITGEVTNENKVYANGKLVLSPDGADQLLKEISLTNVHS